MRVGKDVSATTDNSVTRIQDGIRTRGSRTRFAVAADRLPRRELHALLARQPALHEKTCFQRRAMLTPPNHLRTLAVPM